MQAHQCSECGVALPVSARAGRCPACLFRLALSRPLDLASSNEASPQSTFGDYEFLEPIGRGGMGVVWKARQRRLNRVVALKLMLSGRHAEEGEVKRFIGEARSAATLQHPNVVAIHEVGEHEGQHFFSMDFIDGKSLSEIIRRTPLPPQRAARYVQAIAAAIHYAHGKGILHRDLKPQNVLIDATDQPRITDFGLAKQIEVDSDLTQSGAILGTPSYMPPEQAAGKRREITATSDVYSIGAILYDCLTGRPPFRADTPVETLRQVLEVEPAAPRLLNRKVPRDLEVICLKCLAKDPQRRYPTAAELADDLQRFLHGEPILARPASRADRFWRWCRRRPAVAALTGAVVILFLLTAIAAVLFRQEALENNIHAARLAADNVRAELMQLGRAVGKMTSDASLVENVKRPDRIRLTEFLRQMSTAPEVINASAWLRFGTLLALDAKGERLARWPTSDVTTNSSFRDYFSGPWRGADTQTAARVHFSKVFRSIDDKDFKFSLSKGVRDAEGRFLGVISAMVTTTSTEGTGLTTAQRKTVLVAQCDTNAVETLPNFVIMLHPAFKSREEAVPISHRNLVVLAGIGGAFARAPFDRDAKYRDPVAKQHRLYAGRWLAGFARVADTPFIVIFQSRDWIMDALFFAGVSATVIFAVFLLWQTIRRRHRRRLTKSA